MKMRHRDRSCIYTQIGVIRNKCRLESCPSSPLFVLVKRKRILHAHKQNIACIIGWKLQWTIFYMFIVNNVTSLFYILCNLVVFINLTSSLIVKKSFIYLKTSTWFTPMYSRSKKRKRNTPYLFKYKLSYRNETDTNHHIME